MNIFAPGLREAARIFGRLLGRARLLFAQRKLARAEAELGLLGWQQADFEGEALQHVRQLTDFEREQSRLTNESAALALAIRRLQDERAAARQQHDETCAQLEAGRARVAAPVAEDERRRAARRRAPSNFGESIAALERELREVSALYSELLAVEPQTPEIRRETIRLHGRKVAIPNEQAGLRTGQQQAAHEVRALEDSLARGRLALAAVEEKLRVQRADFEGADGAREKEIADREREKATVEKESEALEKAKGNPYRKIGQLLADSGIAPMNQPHALAAVQQGRKNVAGLERDIAASREASGREDRAALWKSWVVLAVVAGAIILVAWWFCR